MEDEEKGPKCKEDMTTQLGFKSSFLVLTRANLLHDNLYLSLMKTDTTFHNTLGS